LFQTFVLLLTIIRLSSTANQRPFVQDFSCDEASGGTILCNASTTRAAPVFSLQYGSRYKKFLAAADEDGYVSIINTEKTLPTGLDDAVSSSRPVAQWKAHRNAIFDLSWANVDRWMYTASGDMTISLWDTSYAYKITTFHGHIGSVKSVSVSPHAAEIFATGGCDGNLLIWDARVHTTCTNTYHGSAAHRHPVLKLYYPHPRPGQFASRQSQTCNIHPTVTAVQFLGKGSGHMLASGGLDGVVKFWDLRYTIAPSSAVHAPEDDVHTSMSKSIQRTNRNSRLVHLADTPPQTIGKRTFAVTSLALRPDSSQLLVSLKSGHHVMYDVDRPEIGPVKWYGGHTVSSFYVKTAFSGDGSHFASGSSDDQVCIWQVDATPDDGGCCAPYTLKGHESEVTAVAWCPTDFCQLATTADDHTIKVWNINRKQEEEKQEAPPGWVAQPRAEIILAAKPKNLVAVAAAAAAASTPSRMMMEASQEENINANTDDIDDNNNNRMMIDSENNNNNNNQAFNSLEAVAVTTPGTATALNSSRLATTANPTTRFAGRGGAPTSTGNRIRIANALRLSLIQKSKMKRTKQQTLAEALNAARATQAAREERDLNLEDGGTKQQQRRPRSAGTSTSSEEENASQQPSQNPAAAAAGCTTTNTSSSPCVDENQPMNI
jgi:denticleless